MSSAGIAAGAVTAVAVAGAAAWLWQDPGMQCEIRSAKAYYSGYDAQSRIERYGCDKVAEIASNLQRSGMPKESAQAAARNSLTQCIEPYWYGEVQADALKKCMVSASLTDTGVAGALLSGALLGENE